MNQETYRKLISGQSRGLVAVVGRFFLQIAAAGYSSAIGLRNFLYSSGRLKTHHVNATIFSIGNITTGGTGKTPLVIWLYRFLNQKELRCAILTRGYKTRTEGRETRDEGRETKIDEPAILAESCPQAKVVVNPDRIAGAIEAVNKFGANVLILDDGFQHRRLVRNIDIVAIDATRPFGYGKILPAGLLREPPCSLKRADAIVLTRCDQTSEAQLSRIEEKLHLINPDLIITRSIHNPTCAKTVNGEEIAFDKLKGKKIFGFCGIGNPEAFFSTIKKLGADLIDSKVYNDHHCYTGADMTDICQKGRNLRADYILTTQKDWTKIASLPLPPKGIPFAYVTIELKFTAGEDNLKHLIEETLTGKIS